MGRTELRSRGFEETHDGARLVERITDPAVVEGYLTDASNVHGKAEVLVRPASTEEVAEVVRHCQGEGIPLTVSAARTSLTAGPVPDGGWLLSTERLRTIRALGSDTATADAGVLLGDLQREVEARGRLYPPDPTSRNECTLGGSIACNASGARSFRYGSTRRWVEALEVVLPSGEILEVRRGDPVPSDWPVPRWRAPAVKTAAGYAVPRDLLDLFVGQEGTLGVVTRATVRLTDLPRGVLGFLAWFPDSAAAVSFAAHARDAARRDPDGPLAPRCLEYLDRHGLALARARGFDVPTGAASALACEQEVTFEEDRHLAAWFDALEAHRALADDTVVASDDPGRARLHALRHAVPAGIAEAIVRNGMPKVATDLAVPPLALPEMMAAYEAAPVRHVLFGHIGDAHLHLNQLPRTADELERARAYRRELTDRAIALGGTVSGEHGIGKIKKDDLRRMVAPEVLEGFRRLKAHLDPAWILGRGTLFDPA